MMIDELLPCPFCGGQAEIHATHDVDTGEIDGWFVWCNNKRCECMPETSDHFTEAEAIAAWNARAEIMRCDSCKYYDERGETSEVYAGWRWCDRLTVYMPPNGFCSFGKPRWLVCKCGEEIESTGGAFAVCPSCGRKVANE